MEAARAVCADAEVSVSDVTNALRMLIRKSLIVPERSGGVTRVRQLETLRSFAATRLVERGETDLVARDREHYVDLAVRAATDRAWRDRVSTRLREASAGAFEDRRVVDDFAAFLEEPPAREPTDGR